MPTTEQKKQLLKAKIAVALHDELGRVSKTEEIDNVFLLARVSSLRAALSKKTTEERRSVSHLLIFTPQHSPFD
jgi:hypothetical protein